MIVKVYIKRRITDGGDKEAFKLLNQIRINAMDRKGYISGETLVSADDPQVVLVVSTWKDMESWNQWKEGAIRREIDARLEALQVEPTTYEVFVYSKFRLYVQKGFPDPPETPT